VTLVLPSCQICGGTCALADVVDFNKSCAESWGDHLPLSGDPVYYARCANCGFCFAPDMMRWTPEQFAARVYNDGYLRVDPGYVETRPRDTARRLAAKFHGRHQAFTHLDYGGGRGRMSELLREQGWRSTSYDPFVDKDVQVGALGRFDLVTAFEVFEHVPDVRGLMARLRALLAPGGIVLFSTLLSDGHLKPGERIRWWYASPRNGHIALYSRDSLAVLARLNGFTFAGFSNSLHVFFSTIPPWAAHLLRPPPTQVIKARIS
jgi:SAM-dependent methyltransferase